MLIPDVNLLVYAYNMAAPKHAAALKWWETAVNSRGSQVGVVWPVFQGFVRLMTGRNVLASPLTTEEVFEICQEWWDHGVLLLGPTRETWLHFRALCVAHGLVGSATSDGLIAAFALEHRARLVTNDTDFLRFTDLRTENPLE